MTKPLIVHVDEAKWTQGGPILAETYPGYSEQLIGDLRDGPWIFVMKLAPGFIGPPHAHDTDEIIYVLEGQLNMNNQPCGKGTVIFIEKNTEYSFNVSSKGVQFLNIRPAPAMSKYQGEKHWKSVRD